MLLIFLIIASELLFFLIMHAVAQYFSEIDKLVSSIFFLKCGLKLQWIIPSEEKTEIQGTSFNYIYIAININYSIK